MSLLSRLYCLCHHIHKLLQLAFTHKYDIIPVIEHPCEYRFLKAQESQQVFFNGTLRDEINDIHRLMLSQAVYTCYTLLQYCRVPWNIQINNDGGALQIQAYSACIG